MKNEQPVTQPVKPRTICNDCIHMKNDATFNVDVWYSFRCGHKDVRIPKYIDCVSGKLVPKDEETFPHCREINKRGECQLFESQ